MVGWSLPYPRAVGIDGPSRLLEHTWIGNGGVLVLEAFAVHVNAIDPEPIDSFIEPEPHGAVVNGPPGLLVLPV